MEFSEGENDQEGLRQRKIQEKTSEDQENEEGKSSDLMSRIFESTKELTDLPSAKRFVSWLVLLLYFIKLLVFFKLFYR